MDATENLRLFDSYNIWGGRVPKESSCTMDNANGSLWVVHFQVLNNGLQRLGFSEMKYASSSLLKLGNQS